MKPVKVVEVQLIRHWHRVPLHNYLVLPRQPRRQPLYQLHRLVRLLHPVQHASVDNVAVVISDDIAVSVDAGLPVLMLLLWMVQESESPTHHRQHRRQLHHRRTRVLAHHPVLGEHIHFVRAARVVRVVQAHRALAVLPAHRPEHRDHRVRHALHTRDHQRHRSERVSLNQPQLSLKVARVYVHRRHHRLLPRLQALHDQLVHHHQGHEALYLDAIHRQLQRHQQDLLVHLLLTPAIHKQHQHIPLN